jgi:hypothetical protein
MDFKAFKPDFGVFSKTEWNKPNLCKKNYLYIGLAAIMVIFAFLPWLRYSAIESGDPNEVINGSRLGITTWYGIVGFVGALVTAYGVLYKQKVWAFWGAVLAFIMGWIGANSYADIKFDDYVVFKETMEQYARAGQGMAISHFGANVFMLAAAFVAVLSFIKIVCKEDETKETSQISKVALVLSTVVSVVLCVESFTLSSSCLSSLAGNILAWNLPLVCILIVAYSYVNDKKEGKSNANNVTAFAVLVVAFLFTSPALINTKANKASDVERASVEVFEQIDDETYDAKDENKALEKKQEEASKDKLQTLSPGKESVTKKNSGNNDGGNYGDRNYGGNGEESYGGDGEEYGYR